MKSDQIPFNKYVGLEISSKEDVQLELPADSKYENHIGTVHASAQFALAEAATGEFLLKNFGHLVGKTIPVVRKVDVKYRKPAVGRLFARVSCKEEEMGKLEKDLERRGLARLALSVAVEDESGESTMKGKVHWVIQWIKE